MNVWKGAALDLLKIADGLYCIESSMKMPLMMLPLRCHVVRDRDGTVVIISPVLMDQVVVEKIRALGKKFIIVAPSLFHHLFVPQAKEWFPEAELVGTLGMDGKRPDISWSRTIGNLGAISGDLEVQLLAGMPKVNELCILHRPSKTLMVVDLFFNLINSKGFGARLVLGAFGTYRKFGVSRFFLMFATDARAMKASLAGILALPFERLSLAHGEIVEGRAQKVARNAAIAKDLLVDPG